MLNELFLEGGAYGTCFKTTEWIRETDEAIVNSIKATFNQSIFVKKQAERLEGLSGIILSYHVQTQEQVNSQILEGIRTNIRKNTLHLYVAEEGEDVLVKGLDIFGREELQPPSIAFLVVSTSKPKPIKLRPFVFHEPSSRRCSI